MGVRLMQRLLMDDLVKWKENRYRKPLILQGVRQCGKTYLLQAFASLYYQDLAYFNFEDTPALAELFERNLEPERIITELGVLQGSSIKPASTLIVFDEIQFCPKALPFLKYFYEKTPEYHLACAGSLLGIHLAKPSSFPVGKVDFLTLRPISFEEYLLAHDEEAIVRHIKEIEENSPLPKIFTDKLTSYLKSYYLTGGMPEVVARWTENKDISVVEEAQDAIINAYELDFAKYAPLKDFPKLSLIFRSIPDQLARENGKFIYGRVKPGARSRDLEDALEWLIGAGIAHKVCKVEKPAMPLSVYANRSHFKLYLADIGLLRRMARLPATAIFEERPLFSEFKGVLAENFVLNELININGDVPYYWRSGNQAEVDFLAQVEEQIIPVEVKASTNLRSRSLAEYRKKFNPEIAVRTSLANLKREERLLNLPLYLLFALKRLL